jgi:hypothetical protein
VRTDLTASPIGSTLLIALAVIGGGCGTLAQRPASAVPGPVTVLPWPSPSDYTTIKIAVAVRDRVLFHESDWRRKSFAASLAAQTLLTVRMAPGPCADYVTELYGTLRDMMDAYAGENWRPLVALVRRQPSLASVCLAPRAQLAAGAGV